MVRLLPLCFGAMWLWRYGFNPTMVRLLQRLKSLLHSEKVSFNPTMVRLLLIQSGRAIRFDKVSIPQWCDCCIAVVIDTSGSMSSFNPTMVRLLREGVHYL